MLSHYTEESLITVLKSIGYTNIVKKSGNKFAILTDKNRSTILQNVASKIPNSIYDKTPTSKSSIGEVKIDKFSILAKPASRQGSASAGVNNEKILVDTINKLTKTGPINVIFKAPNKTYYVTGCFIAKSVGSDVSGRKKADIILIDQSNKLYPISIKKDNAEAWESADTYFNKQAKILIERAVSNRITTLVDKGTYFMIEPNIAVPATRIEKESVVFGSDIKNNGAVITKTFSPSSFNINEDTLTIECSYIITDINDVKGDKDVFFLIRNDKTRKSIKEYPGIRILAVYKKRINPNIKVMSR
jgi:hypothetical protein